MNNGAVSRYPSCSLIYNAVDSGLAAAECTLCEWAWLAKNCARVKINVNLKKDLNSLVNPLWIQFYEAVVGLALNIELLDPFDCISKGLELEKCT